MLSLRPLEATRPMNTKICDVAWSESFTSNVTPLEPAAVGTPERYPVAPSSVTPAGSVPVETRNVYGGYPPMPYNRAVVGRLRYMIPVARTDRLSGFTEKFTASFTT